MRETKSEAYLAQGVTLLALESIIEDSKVVLDRLTTIKANDELGRMITYFIYKQLDHAISVHKLSPSMDVVLIVRAMVEGVINLSWILEHPQERVKDWLDYTAVNNYELLLKKKENGVAVSEEEQTEILNDYKKVKDRFLQPNGRKHYENYRRGKSLRDIAEAEPMLKNFYAGIYKYFSDWSHWGSQSLHHAVIQTPDVISYYEDDHSYLIPAIVAARQCLYEVTMVTDSHFKLGCEEGLKNNYEHHDGEISKIL